MRLTKGKLLVLMTLETAIYTTILQVSTDLSLVNSVIIASAIVFVIGSFISRRLNV